MCHPSMSLGWVFFEQDWQVFTFKCKCARIDFALTQKRCKNGVSSCNIHSKTKLKLHDDTQDLLCVISFHMFLEP